MNITQACNHIQTQLSSLLEDLTAEQYTKPAVVLNNNTIGQHLRHTVEFFICLEEGAKRGVVNYDKRSHDKLIESDKFIATAASHGSSNLLTSNTTNCH